MGLHYPGQCIMTNTDQFFVKVCGCGVVHLNFGVAVINVTAETAVAISETLREVATELRSKLPQFSEPSWQKEALWEEPASSSLKSMVLASPFESSSSDNEAKATASSLGYPGNDLVAEGNVVRGRFPQRGL